MLLRVFILRGRFCECYFLLINSSIFLAREREFDFLNYFLISVVFSKINPKTFKNSSKSMYKLKMKVGLVFDCGRDFIILLDISVHSLLSGVIHFSLAEDIVRFIFSNACILRITMVLCTETANG